jgi:hypothetical protein
MANGVKAANEAEAEDCGTWHLHAWWRVSEAAFQNACH